MTHQLDSVSFEWHDLPIARIAITQRGVVIDVLPFNDSADRYDWATLSLTEADSIDFNIQGKLSLKELDTLEITDFEIAESAPGRITDTIGMLYRGTGYWTIHVANAICQVEQHGSAATEFPRHE